MAVVNGEQATCEGCPLCRLAFLGRWRLLLIAAVMWPILAFVMVSCIDNLMVFTKSPSSGTGIRLPSGEPTVDVKPVPTPSQTSLSHSSAVQAHWFIPGKEGWFCDYQYVQTNNGEYKMKTLPRGEGLGKILILSAAQALSGQLEPFKWALRSNAISGQSFYYFLGQNSALLLDSKWTLVAVNQWGYPERILAIEAKFGDSKALVGMPSKLRVGDLVPLAKHNNNIGRQRFPGISGVSPTVYAYE